ncbi:heat-inducible transcriptional repressor HrcA [Chromatiales bacterium (ex Bugula neritina AB1)]|nr:heat-inducible transcriptional repressor HrcA [Chromatiales bacterium (ex Bugula neritina AB1)]
MDNFTPIREIGEREQKIFRMLVEQYIQDGCPVGSRTLSKMPGINVSAASVRNVMCDLEEMGLLAAPHTSAGRVPTCDGFRLFVDTMLEVQPLVEQDLSALKGKLTPDQDEKSIIRHASNYLSGFTSMAGLVTLPKRGATIFRQIEFLPLSEQRVLVILVVNEKQVQNRILTLDKDYSSDELQQIANFLNQQYAGKDLEAVRDQLRGELDKTRVNMNDQMEQMISMAGRVFENDDNNEEEDVIVAGQTNLMNFSELSDMANLRDLFDAFAHKRDIYHLLERCISADGVQIFIGQESGYDVLDMCSLVTSSYKVDGEVVGILGVVGPTRMAYDRVVPVVDMTSKLLSAALNSSS